MKKLHLRATSRGPGVNLLLVVTGHVPFSWPCFSSGPQSSHLSNGKLKSRTMFSRRLQWDASGATEGKAGHWGIPSSPHWQPNSTWAICHNLLSNIRSPSMSFERGHPLFKELKSGKNPHSYSMLLYQENFLNYFFFNFSNKNVIVEAKIKRQQGKYGRLWYGIYY